MSDISRQTVGPFSSHATAGPWQPATRSEARPANRPAGQWGPSRQDPWTLRENPRSSYATHNQSRLGLATENVLITWRDLLHVGAPAVFGDQFADDRGGAHLSGWVVLVPRSRMRSRRLSFVPATSVSRWPPWSGIFCIGFLELGSQLVEVMRGDHLHERAVACDRYPGRAGVQVLDLPPVAVLAQQSGQLARAGGSGSVLVLAHLMPRPAGISSDPPPA
jgi:hypothetical protein